MQNIAYYNGKYAPIDEMMIPMNDRAVFFGDGIYEAVYARNGKIFALKEHMDRLRNSLKIAQIKEPMSFAEMEAVMFEAISKVDAAEQLVYFQISRGTHPRLHAFPPEEVPSNFMLFSRPTHLTDVSKPHKLCTAEDIRWGLCRMKSLNLMANCMAAQKAKEQGCYECVLHRDGFVTECSSSNVFMIKDGVLCTAPEDNSMLPGITRLHTLALAHKIGLPVREAFFTVEELFAADEVLVTSTTTPVLYTNEIDGKPAGGKAPELVAKLQAAFTEFMDAQVGAL